MSKLMKLANRSLSSTAPSGLERLKPACEEQGFSVFIGLQEAKRGNLQVAKIGGVYYAPKGSVAQLVADRLAGKR
jgi:hypothetical protein